MYCCAYPKEELMLKDKLKVINKTPRCVYGSFYSTLDSETKQALDDAMYGDAITSEIYRALKSEGCEASETTLRRIRAACYQPGNPCKCISGGNK
jgi:ABC-type phosphate/phosphonate transport system substrate-binding protein